MPNKLTFALKLSKTFEADISWQTVILLPHVTHKEFVTWKLLVAALAFHLLRLLKEIQVGEDKLEL
jgi:hypothetical protein